MTLSAILAAGEPFFGVNPSSDGRVPSGPNPTANLVSDEGYSKRLDEAFTVACSVRLTAGGFFMPLQVLFFVCTSSFHDSPLSLGIVNSIPQETAVPKNGTAVFFYTFIDLSGAARKR